MSKSKSENALFADTNKPTKVEKPKAKPQRRKDVNIPGMPSDKLKVTNQQAGFHYVWRKDDGGNIQEFIDSGYEYVQNTDPERVASMDMTGTGGSTDSRVRKVGGRDGTILYLLRISQDLYDEHQAMRDAESEAPLREIKEGQANKFEGSYVRQAELGRK